MNARLFWLGPVIASVLALMLYLCLSTPAFVLVSLLAFPIILAALITAYFSALPEQRRRSPFLVGVALSFAAPLVLLPTLLFFAGPLRDYARLHAWCFGNSSLCQVAARTSGVLAYWEGWGFAGDYNDVYLVSDPSLELSGASMSHHAQVLPEQKFAVAKRWSTSLHLPCELVWVSHLQHSFYLVTTSNCEMSPTLKL